MRNIDGGPKVIPLLRRFLQSVELVGVVLLISAVQFIPCFVPSGKVVLLPRGGKSASVLGNLIVEDPPEYVFLGVRAKISRSLASGSFSSV